MDSISTSFNKAGVDHCSDRCISVLRHSYFTPDELNCFQRYAISHLDVLAVSSNLCRTCPEWELIPRKSTSKPTISEVIHTGDGLWSSTSFLSYFIFQYTLTPQSRPAFKRFLPKQTICGKTRTKNWIAPPPSKISVISPMGIPFFQPHTLKPRLSPQKPCLSIYKHRESII